jgi:hypothetical protein
MSLVDPAPLGSSSSVVSPTDSRFSFPPLRLPEILVPATVGNAVGSCSLGAYSSAIACSNFLSFDVLPLQVPSYQSCFTCSLSFSGAVELGKRLGSSSTLMSNSKPFLKYYRKAREARKMHMEEILFADSLEALRPAQGPGFQSLIPTVPAEKVDVVFSVQDKGKPPSPVRDFLQRGFLNPSPVVTHKVSVVFVSTPVVKEGAATLDSSTAIKGEDFRVNGLT